MPKVSDPPTSKLSRTELADIFDVQPATISKCAHEKFLCRGYAVWEWAEWHPRGNTVRFYRVPHPVLKQKIHRDEWPKYDIFD